MHRSRSYPSPDMLGAPLAAMILPLAVTPPWEKSETPV
jgi:hypothetical protein